MVVSAAKANWKAILGIAATFMGTIVGAGFASGQEIYQFFSRHGLMGFPGLFLAMGLLGWASNRVYGIGLRLQTYSYREILIELLGARLASLADFFFLVFFLLLIGVMFAGSGAVFQEFNLGYGWGLSITLAILVAVLSRGLPGLIGINMVVIPLMFSASLFIVADVLGNHRFVCSTLATLKGNWLLSALQFASYNLVLAIPVLLALAKDCPDQRTLKLGSYLGSICLGVLALFINAAIWVNSDLLQHSSLPMAVLAKRMSSWFFWGFALVLWGEMLTTLLGNVYGLAQRLSDWSKGGFGKWVLILGLAGIVIAQLGFVKLIAIFYPIYGYLSMILLFLLLVRPLK